MDFLLTEFILDEEVMILQSCPLSCWQLLFPFIQPTGIRSHMNLPECRRRMGRAGMGRAGMLCQPQNLEPTRISTSEWDWRTKKQVIL